MFNKIYQTVTKYSNYVYYLICISHIFFSLYLSKFFFKPIKDNVGFEIISYLNNDGIKTLNQDYFIKNVTKVYSYILSIIIILVFWYLVMSFIKRFKDNKPLFLIFLSIFICGLIFILSTYPYFLVVEGTNDFTMNYVYAKEFMPMHWHGFFDNVFMCSNMIFFPHPFSLQFIPYFFGCYLIFFFIYFIVNTIKINNYKIVFIMTIIIFVLPETIPAFITPGRNTTYAIFVLLYLVILIIDYIYNVHICNIKYFVLVLIISIIATWRSEGIIFLIISPLIFYILYINKKEYILNKLNLVLFLLFFVIVFLLLKLPHDYGMKKYYNKDYLIVNTPMPLSAVFLSKDSNLSYKGFKKDLENINSAYPTDYYYKWGGNASLRYNVENGRITRQCGTSFNQNKYIISAYNVLINNYKIWFKKQANNYLIANGFYRMFILPSSKYDNIEKYELNDNIIKYFKYTNDYYIVGEMNIKNEYPLMSNNKYNKILSDYLLKIYRLTHRLSKQFCKYIKIVLTIFIFCYIFFSFIKKQYFDSLIAMNIISIFLAILVFSPDPHYEYYYATYLSQYLFVIYILVKYILKKNYKRENI